jgi:hypothetical protein
MSISHFDPEQTSSRHVEGPCGIRLLASAQIVHQDICADQKDPSGLEHHRHGSIPPLETMQVISDAETPNAFAGTERRLGKIGTIDLDQRHTRVAGARPRIQ